jgi:hypothetical protein
MRISVGIDVAKEVHWATAVDEAGGVVLDRRVPDDPAALEAQPRWRRAPSRHPGTPRGRAPSLNPPRLAPCTGWWPGERRRPSSSPGRTRRVRSLV